MGRLDSGDDAPLSGESKYKEEAWRGQERAGHEGPPGVDGPSRLVEAAIDQPRSPSQHTVMRNANDKSIQFFKEFPFDETISAKFHGRRVTARSTAVRWLAEIGSLGLAHLLSRWFPKLEARLRTEPASFREASHVFVVDSFGQEELIPISKAPVDHRLYGRFLEDCRKTAKQPGIGTPPAMSDCCIASLDYRCNRFLFNPLTGYFLPIHDFPRVPSDDVDACEEGLYDFDQPPSSTGDPAAVGEARMGRISSQRALFGQNDIKVPCKSLASLWIDEVLHPFNAFQLFSIVVWSCEDYYFYALIIFLMTSISVTVTLYETTQNQHKLRHMAAFSCDVAVLRNGQWQRGVSSLDLVPGDVIDLEDIETIPCDLILLNGDTVVDESMLTGETIPLTKSAVSYEEFREFVATNEEAPRYSLFSGTRLLRSRPRHGRPAIGLVLNTGFLTAKGILIQSILFPRPNRFRFYRDSMVFIGVLGGIAAVGFLGGIVVMLRLGYGWTYVITRALDLITVVVPPALPATMSVGAIFALNRLKSRGIFCISPPRINVCAKVGIMCFDKTGTLTEEGLDVLGVVPSPVPLYHVQPSPPPPPDTDATKKKEGRSLLLGSVAPLHRLTPTVAHNSRPLVQLMATCHSIQRINDDLLGDPLDLKMFAFSGWILEEAAEDGNEAIVPLIIRPPGSQSFDLDEAINYSSEEEEGEGEGADHPAQQNSVPQLSEMGIIRCFEFHAGMRRMSVVARELDSDLMQVMTKGSPESIKDICLPHTLPSDYDAVLARYSHAGYRVIACAGRTLPEGTSWLRVQRMPRDQVESGLVFYGFLLFENRLKPQTTGVLKALGMAGIVNVMATGDNLYTAIAVARASGIVARRDDGPAGGGERGCGGRVDGEQKPAPTLLSWESLDTGKIHLADADLLPSIPAGHVSAYALAMTGTVFEGLIERHSFSALQPIMARCRVFARMSPQQKQTLVELFQSYGRVVGFCGDGANDCGALKAADVGVSLSVAEASVAAPFTSRQQHIGCVVDLLREGRAALATSFSCFKFMALYSMVQFTTLSLMYLFKTSLSDGQFIYIDLLLIIPFGVLLARFGPAPAIHPQPPTARLISAAVLSAIVGQVVIQLILQVAVAFIVARQYGFSNLTASGPSEHGNAALFLSSNFLYSTAAVVFSFGHPHRQRVFWPFIVFAVATFIVAAMLCIVRIGWIDRLLELGNFSRSDGLLYAAFGGVHLVASLVYDAFICSLLVRLWKQHRPTNQYQYVAV